MDFFLKICIDNDCLENIGYAEYNLVSEAGGEDKLPGLQDNRRSCILIDYLPCGVVMPCSDCRMFLCEHLSQTCAYITSRHEPVTF